MSDPDLKNLESSVFSLCREVTGGREHLDVYQCLEGITLEVRRLRDVASSALVHAAVTPIVESEIQRDSLTRLTSALSRIS